MKQADIGERMSGNSANGFAKESALAGHVSCPAARRRCAGKSTALENAIVLWWRISLACPGWPAHASPSGRGLTSLPACGDAGSVSGVSE